MDCARLLAMKTDEALWAIVTGLAAIVLAVFNKHFYWRHSIKEAPRWAGRLLFGIIGVLFILAGARYFFGGQ